MQGVAFVMADFSRRTTRNQRSLFHSTWSEKQGGELASSKAHQFFMPFQNVKLPPSPLADALTPDAFFGANSLFDERTRQGGANDKKKLVAEFIAKNFTTIGGSALLTDGSSTFFVGLAIAL